MNKKIIFSVIVISMFLLSGCKGGGDAGGAPSVPFIGGTNGLIIEFEEGNPPDEIIDDGSFGFQALVKLKNDGEYEVEKNKVKVSLMGIDPVDFSTSLGELKNKYPDEDLLPKRRDAEGNYLEPTTAYITFPSESSEMVPKEFTGNTAFTLRAEVCYMYQTQAVAQMCVLKDLINIRDDSICRPSESKSVYSSAAPVQVQNFRQSISGKDKVGFNFDIVHSNNGNILKYGDGNDYAHCPKDPRERRTSENKIKVKVETGLNNLKCVGISGGSSTEGYVKLSSGKRSVSCYQELPSDRSDYEKEVKITLQYNYEEYKDKDILVKHLTE